MIEILVRNYLQKALGGIRVVLEWPQRAEGELVLIEKTGGRRVNYLNYSTVAVQSYADSLAGAAKLNEKVKTAMFDMILEPWCASSRLDSDYPFNDEERKRYRYQAVFDMTHD